MKATQRKFIARLFPGNHIVELNTLSGTVAIREPKRRTRKTYTAAELFSGELVKPVLTLRSNQTIEFRGKLRRIVADIDTVTGAITVRPEGITKGRRAVKTYNFADLFTWGPQLQLL